MRRFPAEFEKQSFIQVIFPHAQTDWAPYLEAAEKNFIDIITNIITYQNCLVVCHDIKEVSSKLPRSSHLHFIQANTNDTWARDCSAISVYQDDAPLLLDFKFTAWGGKFEANLDNEMSQNISSVYQSKMQTRDFILEGGSLESNGKGTLLITQDSVFNTNRNKDSQDESVQRLKEALGISNILCLQNGYLSGDDTDSHIDTLARFVDERTIVYVTCEDKEDEHYEALQAMQTELKEFKDQDGKPFKLVPLPFTRAIYDENERLPATYANFLILNDAVLAPTYQDDNDTKALDTLAQVFPSRKIIGIDCSTLIRQHGSLHCVTMQFPSKVNLLD